MAASKKARNIVIILILAALAVAVVIYTAVTQAQQYAKNQPAASPTGTSLNINPDAKVAEGSYIYINEIMSGNKTAVLDNQGQYSDWFELYNPNDAQVDLTGWGLSDNQKKPIEWTFPNVSIPANGYILVYCSGKPQSVAGKPLHANFRLSSKGDAIILTDNKGAVVDKMEVPAMDANTSYGRTTADPTKWAQFPKFTPGFTNDDNGYAQYVASLQLPADQKPSVVLSEMMAKNTTIFKDDTGQYSDWIEITNTGGSDVNLKGFGLSDEDANPMKWKFPDISIKPGEYLVVFCSGATSPPDSTDKKALHAPFRLSTYQGVAVLSDTMGRAIDRVTTKELGSDMSFARKPEGWAATSKPTPGYPNTDAGYTDFTKNNPVALGDVVISEASNTNLSTIASAKGNYYDWVEVHNVSSHAVNLKDFALTDNTANPSKWRFPEKTLDAGAYLTVFVSGYNVTNPDQQLNTNFRLNSTSELIALFDKDGKLLDRVPVENLRANMSVGRKDGDTGFFYFATSTPGAANSGGARETLPIPATSVQPGKYKNAQKVTLTAAEGAKIYYTTDGSDPTTGSKLYTGEISVIPETGDRPEGTFPAGTVIRAIAAKDGYIPSATMTASYFIDVPHTLPIVSLVTDPKNFFDENTGIYVHGPQPLGQNPYREANWWNNVEKPAHFEYIDEDGKLGVGLDAAVRIQGQFSRANPNKGLSILARPQYGYSTINYPFFSSRPYTEYKDIVLRPGGQDTHITGIRDVLVSSIVEGQVNCDIQAYKQCVLYINGQYWGINNIREKINEHFVAQHNGIDPASVDLLRMNGGDKEIIAGTNADWKTLKSYVENHDLTVKENYDFVTSQIDVKSYMDFIISEMYVANTDQANVKFYREHKAGAKWKWILYDFCWTFADPKHDSVGKYLDPAGTGVGHGLNNTMIRKLLQNPDFKQKFLNRFAELLKTTFSKERVTAKLNEVVNAINEEKKKDKQRWPKTWGDNGAGTYESWKNLHLKNLKAYIDQRGPYLIYSVQKYFSLSNDQVMTIFGTAGKAPPATSPTTTATPKKN